MYTQKGFPQKYGIPFTCTSPFDAFDAELNILLQLVTVSNPLIFTHWRTYPWVDASFPQFIALVLPQIGVRHRESEQPPSRLHRGSQYLFFEGRLQTESL